MDCFFLDMLQKSAKCKTEIIILKDHNKENYFALYKTQGKTIGLRRSERKNIYSYIGKMQSDNPGNKMLITNKLKMTNLKQIARERCLIRLAVLRKIALLILVRQSQQLEIIPTLTPFQEQGQKTKQVPKLRPQKNETKKLKNNFCTEKN